MKQFTQEEKKDIRLIALDLDGTVFDSHKRISKRNIQAIHAAAAQGIIVIPASGRTLTGLPVSFTKIPGVRYALCSNGAVVFDMKPEDEKGEMIHCPPDYPDAGVVLSEYIPQEKACEVVDLMLAGGHAEVCFFAEGKAFSDRKGYEMALDPKSGFPEWYFPYLKNVRQPIDDLQERIHSGRVKAEKIVAAYTDMELRDRMWKKIEALGGIEVAAGTSFNVEVTAASKGGTLIEFALKMGIRREQVMACGDSSNDLSMIREAGFSVAMANGEPAIRDAADYITLTNDEDGVAYAIEKFVLK